MARPVWPQSGSAVVSLPATTTGRTAVKPDGAKRAAVSVGAPQHAGARSVTRPDSTPAKVQVEVLDHKKVASFGAVGLGMRVARADGRNTAGSVEATVDYSGFAHAFGGDFASRLRLVEVPACALTTPQRAGCTDMRPVPGQHNDPDKAVVTAVVEAAPQTEQISGMAGLSAPALYALVSGSSSDSGDYRASPTNPSGKWDVSLGSGAFTYSVPIEVPQPPVGIAPDLALTYNSQSVDGRTSASNNQASWVGMGWDLNVGAIERRYKSCADDGHGPDQGQEWGDLCWASPNQSADPNGAVYTISIDGITSELIQDNTGTGTYHIKDDPAWRVQKLKGGYGDDASKEYWVITKQDGTRYYFGWGRTERLNNDSAYEKTNSVLTVPVIGDDAGEPCYDGGKAVYCNQAWRWSMDRVVTANEVENTYFYNKERNYYRSIAGANKARGYDAGSYLSRIDYGWSSQIAGAQLPAMIDFQHVNRCVERMEEKDPLNNTVPACPSFETKPESYPDVPVDLMCDGSTDDEACAGKTYYPTFFQRDVLWDINVHVRDTNTSGWDLVKQYQFKYALMNPSGAVGEQLWLDYIQQRGYAGDDIDLPTINFNGEWQDNKVGSGELNFRRVNKVFTETGATITATYGHATDDDGAVQRQCPETGGTSESSNAFECFWQKWTPEGGSEKTGWFKKFVTKRVQVDPGKANEGSPAMITDYEYDGAPGWRFTADPLVKDADESWSEWRGYAKVLVTTGANENRHSTYHWLYRGLSGDRTSKTDPGATRTVSVKDSDDKAWTDHDWLSGKTLETSVRDHNGDSQKREWHEYWSYNTAQYTGMADARIVRENKVRTLEKVVNSTDGSGMREHIIEYEYDDAEKASTVFGLPLRTDDWGESSVSDNQCTEFGRAYNTDDLADDSTGTKRWMVYQDDERHYSVSCASVDADETAGTPVAHMDRRTVTFYDNATTFDENNTNLVDGNPTEVRTYTADAAWRAEKKQFDAAGRQLKSWDGRNNLTTTTYTPATSWPTGGVKVTTPDPDGAGSRLPMTSTTYQSRFWGTPWKTVDANGNMVQMTYDAIGRLSKVFKETEAANYPDGTASLAYEYTIPVMASATGVPRVATGDPITVRSRSLQDGSTYLDTYTYADGLGRQREMQVKAATGAGRTVTVTRYDSSGNTAGTSAPFYNSGVAGSGLVNPTVPNLPSYTDTKADWAGRTILSQIQVLGAPQAANKTITQYQGADETTVFPAVGSPTKTVKDVYGQTAKVVESLGAAQYNTTYEYTRKGQLKYVHDSRGNTSHYTYNWAGDRLTAEEPDAGSAVSTYDDNGLLATTSSNGKVLSYGYDALKRPTTIKQGTTLLTEKSYDAPAAEVPNGLNRLASTTNYVAGKAYVSKIGAYDSRGHETLTSLTVPADGSGLEGQYTTKASYDQADHLTKTEYPAIGGLPAETVTSVWTDGRLSKVSSPLATYVASVDYDNTGRVRSRDFGGGTGTSVTRDFTYDDAGGAGWLKNISTSRTTGGTTTKVQDDTYTRNSLGTATALRENQIGQQQCFTYDGLQRLSGAWTTAGTSCATAPASDFTGPDPYETSWTYDQIGNIQSTTGRTSASASAVTQDYKYPGYNADESVYTPDQPRPHGVTAVARSTGGSDTYSYNDGGQMTGRSQAGVSSVMEWNAQNRVSRITQKKPTGDEVTSYVYDASGNPLIRNAPNEKVLYLEGHELRKRGTDAPKATRYYSAGHVSAAMREADGTPEGKLTWVLSDDQASTQLTVAAADGTVSRRRYTPFGQQRGSSGTLPTATDRGFLGKSEDDSTGLSMLGARMYDPGIGRFLSTDPITAHYQPQNISAYGYSANNPIAFTDASGLGVPECMQGIFTGCNNGVPDKDSVYHPEREPWYPTLCPNGCYSGSGTPTVVFITLPKGLRPPKLNGASALATIILGETEPDQLLSIATNFEYSKTQDYDVSYKFSVSESEQVTQQFSDSHAFSFKASGGVDLKVAKIEAEGGYTGTFTWTDIDQKTTTATKEISYSASVKKGQMVGLSPSGTLTRYRTLYQNKDGSYEAKTWAEFRITSWNPAVYDKTPIDAGRLGTVERKN
ncbi:RHS repeat-associated core domain-containing protein [Streptomyces sp. NPDC056452]|uniref:RHS repeat domain-containing protein n=1 Tax=Streptomyces sp. NPDC056452 TaxID=3345821 RepID=UPI0036CF41A3